MSETVVATTEAKPKRARTPRKKTPTTTAAEPAEAQPVAVITDVPVTVPKEKKARRAAPKKSVPSETVVPEPLPVAALEKPKPVKRATASKRPKKNQEDQ